ncbi:MAG: TlpA family protein disulfide reductase [Caldilineaceae bacterium]|nr:TlpA family protein disulfide reductase [Caldilineaceae bacterium]
MIVTQNTPAEEQPDPTIFEEDTEERDFQREGLRRLLVWLPVFVALVALLGLLGWGMWRQQTGSPGVITNDGPATVAVMSRPAGDFTMPLYDPFNNETEFQLSNYRGQTVVLNFWASWCPPCREEAPVLEAVWRQYQDQDVIFVGVDIWDTERDARAYMREFNITFPNVIDNRGTVAVEYGLTGVPETYFITPDGMISRKVIGAISQAVLEESIAEARQSTKAAAR